MERRLDAELESMWSSHREYVRRFLLGMTHDLDLVEDLLQDTYLCARRGISGYRGEGSRTWLCAIARRAFLTHVRRPHIRTEVQIDCDTDLGSIKCAGSADHVEALDIRNRLSELPDDLRVAFILKHANGMTYSEIASRMDCAPVTARVRVHRAISRLRSAIDEGWRPAGRTCAGMGTNRIIDYLYNLLRPQSMGAMEDHLRVCCICRERVGDVRALIRAMDASANDYRMMHLLDVDDWGVPSLHAVTRGRNRSEQPTTNLSFGARIGYGACSLAVPGARLDYVVSPYENRPELLHYTADLPEPVLPGQELRSMSSFGPIHTRRATRTRSGAFCLDWDQMPSDFQDCAYTQAIRLPTGARFITSNPAPADVVVNGCTTLIWHTSLMPAERFRSTVEYQSGS